MFIHGVGLWAESWGPQIDYFKSRFTVFAIDLPGHGESELLGKAFPDVQSYSERVQNFINTEIGMPSMVIGHSLGALIGADIAIKYPQTCRAVAAISTVYDRSEQASKAVKIRAGFIRQNPTYDLASSPITRWFNDPLCKEAILCSDMISNNSSQGYADAYHAFAYCSGVDPIGIAKTDTPFLFLTGEEDKNSTPAMSETLSNVTQNATAVIIKDARHMVQLSHAKETNAALDDFIKVHQHVKL